jgi:hypothetical protein
LAISENILRQKFPVKATFTTAQVMNLCVYW